jgi:S-adenosylmethionine:diacylglycerol 3-amino-3-carboxypropyl transferase
MADLVHATLTEDEEVLLGALDPKPGDRCLALFARGNGDAALALLAREPERVAATDWFDPQGLAAQLELKRTAIAVWEPRKFRRWLALEPGMGPGERARLYHELEAKLSSAAQGYWRARREAVNTGLVLADETSQWSKRLARMRPLLLMLDPIKPLRNAVLKLGLSLAGLFFPAEEREHSLGYRQLLNDPAAALDPLLARAGSSPDGDFVQATRFAYLSERGLERLRALDGRLTLVPRDQLPPGSNRIYLSNLIDYLEANEFDVLLQRVIASASPPWRLLFNSTYRSNMQHPHVMNVLGKKLAKVDRELTASLRARDRLGVYPGLTVLVSP